MVSVVKKFRFFIVSGLSLVGLIFLSQHFGAKNPPADLVVYAYSSFTATWGPGPILKKKFEEKCRCRIELRDSEDSRLLIQRVKLEASRKTADVIVGLNQWDVEEAVDTLGFRSLPSTLVERVEEPLRSALSKIGPLIPFDWGVLTINTKRNSPIAVIKSLKESVNYFPAKSLALQDPRTSAPGLSFLFWLVDLWGEDGAFAFFKQLNPKIFTIAPGWSSSYGLFQKNQAQAVFSYVTSPIYHLIEERDSNYLALPFEEGLPIHVELAGVLSSCQHCQRGQEFVEFLLSSEAQKILMEKNFMLPVRSEIAKGTPWDLIHNFKVLPFTERSKQEKQRLLERWTRWLRER